MKLSATYVSKMIAKIGSWAKQLGELSGWKRQLAAFICGMSATLTLAPIYAFPLLLPAFAGLFSLLQGAHSCRQMFWDGWWWGWGFYMSGLYWFCVALLTDVEKFAWLIPFALFGLTGVIAIYSGIACWLMSWLRVRGLSRIVVFAVVWTCVEYLRAVLFTGFPWNLMGYAIGFSEASLQTASLFGIYGLTFYVVMLGLTPTMLLAGKQGKRLAAGLWISLLVLTIWGGIRVASTPQEMVEGITLRLVQANISQHQKWQPNRQLDSMKEQARLMLAPGKENITHFIWPETAVPYVLESDSPLSILLGKSLPKNSYLISGALRAEGTQEKWDIWNTLAVINPKGTVIGHYDKQRLVPFGEFQPLRPFVPDEWMTPVGEKDFAWSDQDALYAWAGLPPVRALICYEAIFTDMPMSSGYKPEWMLNITNDAWFGISSGPYQHFNMTRMRSVERGVPLVRVANTGITAVVDGVGRIIGKLPLGTHGILDAGLPVALEGNTIYTLLEWLYMPLILLLGCVLVWRQRR